MHRRTRRGNHVGLALVGLALMIAGVALFAAYEGWFGSRAAGTSIYPPSARRFVHENGDWLWTVVAIAAIVVGLGFLRWLLVQPRVDRVRRLVVDTEEDEYSAANNAGRTRMPSAAICDIVEDDITELRGVRRASATISGHADAPELWLRVSADADADIARIRRTIVDDVVRDARACLDLPALPTYLRLVVTRHDSPREVR